MKKPIKPFNRFLFKYKLSRFRSKQYCDNGRTSLKQITTNETQAYIRCTGQTASTFNPESVALEAGRIMLNRIRELIEEKADFAFETTLATRSYISLINGAKQRGYNIVLLFFWLKSPNHAIERVKNRVEEGGHHIPDDVVFRRYYRGIANLLDLYIPKCDEWLVFNCIDVRFELIAESGEFGKKVYNSELWDKIEKQRYDKH